jgi:plasmid maintenance system antidote protein VapI
MTRAVVWPAGKKSPHGSGIVTVTTPAQMLRDALQELGWTQTVNEIAQGKKRITATTAYELEAATGIWARDWLEADLENEMRRAARKPIGGIVSRAVKMRKRKEAQ